MIFKMFLGGIVFLLASCGKKDRLSVPTQILRVSPTAAAVKTQTTKAFTASLVNAAGEPQDVLPVWSLSPAAAGTLSPSTGLQSVFTAGQSLGARGLISVSYEGLTAQAQVTVVPETGNTASAYGFYTESLPSGIKIGVANPSDPDGGFLGAFGGGGSGSPTLQAATGVGEYTEGAVGLKASVAGPAFGSFSGYYFSFGFPDAAGRIKDVSTFTNVCLDERVPLGADVRLKLESSGPVGYEVKLGDYITFDDVFHSVCIPLSVFSGGGVSLAQFETLVITAIDINGSYSFYVDNLRFE